MPAPSPLSSSAPTAPRWSEVDAGAVSARVDDVASGEPRSVATKATPQRVVLGHRVVEALCRSAQRPVQRRWSSTPSSQAFAMGRADQTGDCGTSSAQRT